MLKICQLNNIFDKFICIFIHGHVVYLSVYMNNDLLVFKDNKGYWMPRKEKDNQIKQLTFSFIQMCIITLSYKPKKCT